jgi:hypothetical protein
MGDLRPISLIPCLSKVLEKVVCDQLTEYLEDNNILPERQSGFRKGHSTASALADVVDGLLVARDRGMLSFLILLDFSRAFDSINIALLISKLAYYGFDSISIGWFHSYLQNRKQCVELLGAGGTTLRSALRTVPRGVPQGSILGPLLYILYSADMVKQIKHCQHHLYADDLQLYYSFSPADCADALARVNEDLDSISAWCISNCLVLNPKKSKLMLMGSRVSLNRYADRIFNITVNGEVVKRVNEARNLGLVFDGCLNFESHITECSRNCFYRLKLLYKIRPFLSVELRILLCESLILSKLNYCDTIYGPCLMRRTAKLVQRVQNACARFCFFIPLRSHITPYLNASNTIKMEARRRLHLASLLFEVINTGRPRYLYNKLSWTRDQSRYPKRMCTSILSIARHRTMAFRGSFRYAASRCWNDLPPPVRELKTVQTFKKQLKKHMLLIQNSLYIPSGNSCRAVDLAGEP